MTIIGYKKWKFKPTFRGFREGNFSIRTVYSISVLWSSRGDHPSRSSVYPALSRVQFNVLWIEILGEASESVQIIAVSEKRL
jgi:hypothetical protein